MSEHARDGEPVVAITLQAIEMMRKEERRPDRRSLRRQLACLSVHTEYRRDFGQQHEPLADVLVQHASLWRFGQRATQRFGHEAPLRTGQYGPPETALIGGRELRICVR